MFRVVVIVGIAVAPVILLALLVDPLVGAILFGVEIGVAIGFLLQRSRGTEPRTAEVASRTMAVHRVLVVANQTVGGRALLDEIKRRVAGEERSEILVVAPPLAGSAAEHWSSDVDEGIATPEARLDASHGDDAPRRASRSRGSWATITTRIRTRGRAANVRGRRGDHLHAHAERSRWLESGVVEKARRELPQPVTHVVVDLEAEAAGTGEAA